MELADLRAEVRHVVLALAMTSTAPAAGFDPASTGSRPDSRAPVGERDTAAAEFTAAATSAWDDRDRLAVVLERARAALTAIRHSPVVDVRAETEVEMAARCIALGEHLPAVDVATALRCTPTMVRRWRLAAGRDGDTGRPLPAGIANGQPVEFAARLVLAGYSVRAASALAGVARSTVHDAVTVSRAG